MSLVRELEAKRAVEREEQLKAMATYLRSLDVNATLAEEPATDLLGRSAAETVIQLRGQNVQKIWLGTEAYYGYGTIGSVSRFHYEILLDKPLSLRSKRGIAAKTKTVKENKFLGLFGGKVVDIKWVGGDIADRLNSDADLSKLLVDCANCSGSVELRIQTTFPAAVEILGPKFIGPLPLPSAEELATQAELKAGDKLFKFEIYNRIAKHVRDVLSAS